jgi:hypothetical protein
MEMALLYTNSVVIRPSGVRNSQLPPLLLSSSGPLSSLRLISIRLRSNIKELIYVNPNEEFLQARHSSTIG